MTTKLPEHELMHGCCSQGHLQGLCDVRKAEADAKLTCSGMLLYNRA